MEDTTKIDLLTVQINIMRLAMYVDSLTTIMVHKGIMEEEEHLEAKEIYQHLLQSNKELKMLEAELEVAKARRKKPNTLLN